MAGPDPRRSSRPRTSQPHSRPSSTTSSISGRPDRHHKSSNKTGSPQKSRSTVSPTSELPDDTAADNSPPPQPRSRRAAHAAAIKDHSQEPAYNRGTVVVSDFVMPPDDDEIQEDDEAVRCICGSDDYPGPPSPEILQQATKEGFDVQAIFPTVVTEDLAGFFVQCDICKVWQHGACVGLVNDDTLPEDYYCEECRKNFHIIFSGADGIRCSIYQPNSRHRSRTTSFTKDREGSSVHRGSSKDNKSENADIGKDAGKDGSRDGKDGKRSASATQSSKRRSTMNSRDAAYDEEQLRIAIEASKEDASVESVEGGQRRTKRSRSFSIEKADGVKRPRTASRSLSPSRDNANAEDDSDEATTHNGGLKKSARNTASARSQQQREKAEKEEKERQRAEAANKRNGRAERRRADGIDTTRAMNLKGSDTYSDIDSDPSDEVPLATRAASNRPATAGSAAPATTPATATATATAITTSASSSTPAAATTPRTTSAPRPLQPSPETPPPTLAPPMSASKSKGGRPTHKKKGRNQYTKEREIREEQASRSRSRDVPEMGHNKSGSGGGAGGTHGNKSGSRSKGGMSSRVTMTEMKRRVAAMFDFISKTQVELAGEEEADAVEQSPAQHGSATNGAANGVKGSRSPVKKTPDQINGAGNAQGEFTELSCVEMMDCLTRDIVHWQNQFTA